MQTNCLLITVQRESHPCLAADAQALPCFGVQCRLEFCVGSQPLNNFRMIERHYFKVGRPVRSNQDRGQRQGKGSGPSWLTCDVLMGCPSAFHGIGLSPCKTPWAF